MLNDVLFEVFSFFIDFFSDLRLNWFSLQLFGLLYLFECHSHLLGVDLFLLQLNIDHRKINKTCSNSDAFELLGEAIAGELCNNVGDGLGMVEDLEEVSFVADSK